MYVPLNKIWTPFNQDDGTVPRCAMCVVNIEVPPLKVLQVALLTYSVNLGPISLSDSSLYHLYEVVECRSQSHTTELQ